MYAHVCMLVHTYRQARRRGDTHTTARHAAQSPARVTGRKAATRKTKTGRCSLFMCEHLSFQSNPTYLISVKRWRMLSQPQTTFFFSPGMLRAAVLAVRDSFPIIYMYTYHIQPHSSHSRSVHELTSHVKLNQPGGGAQQCENEMRSIYVHKLIYISICIYLSISIYIYMYIHAAFAQFLRLFHSSTPPRLLLHLGTRCIGCCLGR